ncbi:putative small subunit of thiolase DitF (plasmid) [Aromatoleum aromaticum EbN1]|uniref:Small subunit of thiolase DitF n=1 Tax=Aromatoleum aromaticum (strain DSM 19018 / LMG 30748 / EbN1) TaxID=76114 RepID=Q5NW53_AROAE|nr:Zn-ribbon domain-containing OB-fold protein [Aromatoleum aromaticum]CAI10711.1 putative small subunit of thiolase DitF [Aromatoleum aromaticum EbN1]
MSVHIAKRPPVQYFNHATDAWMQPFWDAAVQHSLVGASCAKCGTFRMPPTPFCPHCHSQGLNWVALPGTGTVYSYSVVKRAILPSMEDCLPYVTAIIELDGAGGTRLISNVVDIPVDAVRVDLKVRVVWDDNWGGVTVPRFTADL